MVELVRYLFLELYFEARGTGDLTADRGLSDFCVEITRGEGPISQHIEIGLDLLIIQGQYFEGNPGMCCFHGNQNWSTISNKLVACFGLRIIILGSHENRTTFCVVKQMCTGIAIEEEAITSRPVQ